MWLAPLCCVTLGLLLVGCLETVAAIPPKSEPTTPKKKMSKKERARLEAEQAEHHRMELEKERQRKVEEEKMRKVREKEEAERKQVQEIVANKLRKVQLEESYSYFASIRDEVRKMLAESKKEREWEQYMRCNGLPNAFDPSDLRKYLHIWCQHIRDANEAERNWLLQTNEQSILTQNVNVVNLSAESLKLEQPQIGNTYASKAVEVLGILEEIDEALHDSDVRPSMVQDLNELKVEFRNVLAEYIDEFAYKILSNINRDMELHGLLEASHKFESEVFKAHLFGLRDMPTPQLNPKERAKEDSKHTSIDFPSLGFHLTLPAAVKCHKAAIRGLWISYDHCSDYCPSYDMPYRPELLADLRIISRIEWKKRKEILKAVYEEPKEKKTDSDEDDQTPQDIDVDKIYTEHADELMKKERTKKGAKTLNLGEYDVNMRSHRIVAGVYAIDYLEQPMQDVKIAKKTLLRTVPQPGKLKRKKFYQPYRPPPTPQPGVRRLPEEIEAEIKQMEENLDKLALVSVQLPENVFWFEPPIVCRWELKEETLESDPAFSKYLDRLEKAQQAAKERNERSNLDRRTKYVEDFNILDVPQHIPLRAIVTDFVIPKLADSCSIKISVAEDKRRATPLAGGKRSSKQKRRLHKMPSSVSLSSIVYETKIPDFLFATRMPLRVLKVLDRRNRQCYPYTATSDSDDLDDYDESDNDVVQNRNTKRKVYMFSSFMKDLDELLESKSPKLQAKIEQELAGGTTGQSGGPGKQSLQVARSEDSRPTRGEKGEKGKKPARSKFDSDDEEVDYGNILEVGNYSMVENDKRYIGKWSTRDVHDVKFNEDKLTIQFRVGRLGSFAFAANRYSNVPYQSWELKPDIKNPGTVTFSLTASVVSTEMSITEAGFRVNSLQGGPTQALQEILGVTMSLRKLIKTLRLAAVDLFPEDDAFNYTEGTCEKNPIMESHLYDCIGLLALTHNFSWSRWNLLSGCRMCVLLMREIVEHRRLPNHSTLLVTPLKASVIDTVEVSPVFNPNPVEGMNHYADLYHLGRDQSQPSSRIKQEKMSPILRENVTQLLKSISECAAKGGECDESKGRPVCGSDNKTYPTRCHLIRAQCSGHQVAFKHRGSCKDVCIASRTYALQQRANSPYTVKYVPRCREDGTYAPVQCIDGGGCWCVNGQGKQLPNTMVQHGKPICVKKGKSNQRRSSPRNPVRNKRSCSGLDRAVFNTNLLKLFQNEHVRVHQHNLTGPINEKVVLDWKFAVMDLNGNNLLDKTEYRTMKRLIKKVVKPKRCGRSFGKNCDADQDERLSRNEWYNCLAKDDVTPHNPSSQSPSSSISSSSSGGSGHYTVPHLHHHQHHSTLGGLSRGNGGMGGGSIGGTVGGGGGGGGGVNGGTGGGGGHFLRADDDDDDDSQNISNDFTDDDDDDHSENEYDSDELPDSDNALLNGLQLPVNGLQPYLLLQGKTMVDPKGEDDAIFKDSEADSDCLSDRKYALDEQKYGTNALYVPECTPDGRYQRVQCYRSTGYCWCVNEDTGKNIPGTSTKDEKPVCDQYASSTRPMKGCPEEKKVEFLKDLKAFLSKQVSTSFAGKIIPVWNTEEEKIAILSFVLLDKNQNKQLERKEWKAFRELVTATRQLRKCGKKMPRYCDVNSDRKITLSEWMSCLDGKRNNSVDVAAMSAPLVQAELKSTSSSSSSGGGTSTSSSSATSTKFKGRNPLEFVLKSD